MVWSTTLFGDAKPPSAHDWDLYCSGNGGGPETVSLKQKIIRIDNSNCTVSFCRWVPHVPDESRLPRRRSTILWEPGNSRARVSSAEDGRAIIISPTSFLLIKPHRYIDFCRRGLSRKKEPRIAAGWIGADALSVGLQGYVSLYLRVFTQARCWFYLWASSGIFSYLLAIQLDERDRAMSPS